MKPFCFQLMPNKLPQLLDNTRTQCLKKPLLAFQSTDKKLGGGFQCKNISGLAFQTTDKMLRGFYLIQGQKSFRVSCSTKH